MISLLEGMDIHADRDSLFAYKLSLEKALTAGCSPEEFEKLYNLKHALDIVMQRILETKNTEIGAIHHGV